MTSKMGTPRFPVLLATDIIRELKYCHYSERTRSVPDLATLLKNYGRGPEQLRAAIEDLSPSDLKAVPVPGKWSVHQVVCHVADFEIVSADRMKRVLVEENPTMFGGDPDRFAAGLAYDQRDLESELALITAVRSQVGRVLSTCDIEAFQRTGVHSEDGPMTLETLLERTTSHIPHHIMFIEEKRKALANGSA